MKLSKIASLVIAGGVTALMIGCGGGSGKKGNENIGITDDIVNQAVENKILYSVYYASEGSVPTPLSNVDVFDKNGTYIGSTDSAGRVSIPVSAEDITFKKDEYASVTVKINNSSSTGHRTSNIF